MESLEWRSRPEDSYRLKKGLRDDDKSYIGRCFGMRERTVMFQNSVQLSTVWR